MPKLAGFSLAALATLAFSATTHADAFQLYVQGHGGITGESSSGGSSVGGEVGGKILLFNGYAAIEDYFNHGAVTRVILGFGGDYDLAGWRLVARAGAGLMYDHDGVFGGDMATESRMGVVGRGGLALDHTLGAGLYVGIGVDAEYYALKATDGADTRVHTGADIMGSLHIGFEVGI